MTRVAIIAGALLVLAPVTSAEAQRYRYPFSSAHQASTYVTAHFDHAGKDYNCGTKRYSGHRGNDFGVGSFSGMDAGRTVVAAASGTVEYVNDGEFDRCTTGRCGGGGGYGNYVRIRHADGKASYYAHLKKGSIVVKKGARITCGAKIGQAGSSGYSTGPHLHFEVRKGTARQDTFKGKCGGSGYWVSQGTYLKRPSLTCDGVSTKPKLDAKYVGQGSDALKASGGGNFSLCPGQAVKLWFDLTNTGTATWTDTNKPTVAGAAVRLAVNRKKWPADPLGGPTVSVTKASVKSVKPGAKTRFTIAGKAPTKTGVVRSNWQLTNGGATWFGPALYLTFNVTSKPPGAGAACTTGKKGVCAPGARACSAGALACVAKVAASTEVCGDDKDNDCDGEIDEGCASPGLDAGVVGGDLPPTATLPENKMEGGCGCSTSGGDPLSVGALALLVIVGRRRRVSP